MNDWVKEGRKYAEAQLSYYRRMMGNKGEEMNGWMEWDEAVERARLHPLQSVLVSSKTVLEVNSKLKDARQTLIEALRERDAKCTTHNYYGCIARELEEGTL